MITNIGPVSINYDELATLKQLAHEGALEGTVSTTSKQLAERLEISAQTVSRRLQRLEDAGVIGQHVATDGRQVSIKSDGEQMLVQEYREYRRALHSESDLKLTGVVVGGLGEGQHYVSLPGYVAQFREQLNYEPFPGTLNVELDEDSLMERTWLEDTEGCFIEGWEDEDRTFGPAECYRAELEAPSGTVYEPVHILVPKRTHHDEGLLEIIAPEKLRETLDLEDHDEVTIHVH